MLDLAPELGDFHAITSLTTTTCVVSRLATGTVTAAKMMNKWMLRGDAASQPADRERIISNFASSTGTLTHAGANYADTTATSETVEILEHEPRLYDDAIQETLRTTRYMDLLELPTTVYGTRWLGALSNIVQPSDIERIQLDRSGVISQNRWFNRWPSYNSSGVLVPEGWTISGASGTVVPYTIDGGANTPPMGWAGRQTLAKLTRSGTDVTLTQSLGDLVSDVFASRNSMKGMVVTLVLVGFCASTPTLQCYINDGVTTSTASSITASTGWTEVTKQVTLSTSALRLDVAITLSTANGSAYIGECYLTYGAVNDTHRQANIDLYEDVWARFGGQGGLELPVYLPKVGLGSRYLLSCQRTYPALDQTRFLAGTADADTVLAPIDLIATGAIWRMHDRLAGKGGEDTSRYRAIAKDWKARYEALQLAHLYRQGRQNATDRKLDRLRGGWMASAGAGVRS